MQHVRRAPGSRGSRHTARPRSPAALGAASTALVNRCAHSRSGWKRRPGALPSSAAGASQAPQPNDEELAMQGQNRPAPKRGMRQRLAFEAAAACHRARA